MSITAEQIQKEASQYSTVSTPIKAVVVGTASSVRERVTGSEYVYIKVQLTEGKASGCIVLGTRTTKNAKGETKDIPAIGDEVVAYHTKLPSREVQGDFVHFFEISTSIALTDNSTLSSLL
jgi:hypothetical protein